MVCMSACYCSMLIWRHFFLYVYSAAEQSHNKQVIARVSESLLPPPPDKPGRKRRKYAVITHWCIDFSYCSSVICSTSILLCCCHFLSRRQSGQGADDAEKPQDAEKFTSMTSLRSCAAILDRSMWNRDKISFNCCKSTASNDCDIIVQAQTTAIFWFDFIVTCTVN